MADQITTSEITVNALRGYLSRPADDGGAGVPALSWDPFHGPSSDDTPMERLFELMGKFDDETVLGEQAQLLDHMFGELGLRRVGGVGWCTGGPFPPLRGGRAA